jgi:hypothetical protein
VRDGSGAESMERGQLQMLKALVLFVIVAIAVMHEPGACSPLECVIPVVYRSQETGYYCGPAVVQMALGHVVVAAPSQDMLASEMETDPVEGVTYTDMMRVPFETRNLADVYEGTLELEDLQEATDHGFLTIILIYFSTALVYQHYVLVIGYNASGIYVHDPWPLNASQPAGRSTGANTFISTYLLADLWACDPAHWGLVIPYSTTPGEVPSWWQQYWYLLTAVPVTISAVTTIILVKRKTSTTENSNTSKAI